MTPEPSVVEPERGPEPPEATDRPLGQSSAAVEEIRGPDTDEGSVIETIVSPFHCLYQDALHFHTQSRVAQSEGEAARLARAALLLYVSSARLWSARPPLSWDGPNCGGCWPIRAARSPWRKPGGSYRPSSPNRACRLVHSIPSLPPGRNLPSC